MSTCKLQFTKSHLYSKLCSKYVLCFGLFQINKHIFFRYESQPWFQKHLRNIICVSQGGHFFFKRIPKLQLESLFQIVPSNSSHCIFNTLYHRETDFSYTHYYFSSGKWRVVTFLLYTKAWKQIWVRNISSEKQH